MNLESASEKFNAFIAWKWQVIEEQIYNHLPLSWQLGLEHMGRYQDEAVEKRLEKYKSDILPELRNVADSLELAAAWHFADVTEDIHQVSSDQKFAHLMLSRPFSTMLNDGESLNKDPRAYGAASAMVKAFNIYFQDFLRTNKRGYIRLWGANKTGPDYDPQVAVKTTELDIESHFTNPSFDNGLDRIDKFDLQDPRVFAICRIIQHLLDAPHIYSSLDYISQYLRQNVGKDPKIESGICELPLLELKNVSVVFQFNDSYELEGLYVRVSEISFGGISLKELKKRVYNDKRYKKD